MSFDIAYALGQLAAPRLLTFSHERGSWMSCNADHGWLVCEPAVARCLFDEGYVLLDV